MHGRIPPMNAPTLHRIGVIGAGTMGNGIAQVCAVAGLPVTMVEINDDAVQRGNATIAKSLDRLVSKEKLSAAAVGHLDAPLARPCLGALLDGRGVRARFVRVLQQVDQRLRQLRRVGLQQV